MLTHLHIRHFAIIDASELELSAGMTALTGETGAGKSILLDALGLITGARAATDSVQQGENRADITATFSLETLPDVVRWLVDNDLDADEECIIRRTLNANGKSRATINDVPVSVQLLRTLGRKLVSIYGQHAHQKLADATEQRVLLDNFSGNTHADRVAKAFTAWQLADTACANHARDAAAREQRLDLISFQLREFDELDIGSASFEDIESEHRWRASADRILSLGNEVLSAIDEQAYPALNQSITPLKELVSIDERLRESLDLIESASIQVAEATHTVQNLISQLDHDDTRLTWLDQKLAVLHRLSRKHQCEIDQLSDKETQLRDEYEQLADPALSADELLRERDALREIYDQEAAKLTRHRKKHAKNLSATITRSMQNLNMQGGIFDIRVNNDKTEPTPNGTDSIEFLVSSNPGVSPAALSKVASGGELSRISLSLQLATLDTQPVPTLIFDEVDSGVGGAVAETVGKLLRSVGNHAQVLCVTHLPQVASQAHQHLMVSKQVSKGKTFTQVLPLDAKATLEEIARMLGGAKITAKSRQHAQEMLDSAS